MHRRNKVWPSHIKVGDCLVTKDGFILKLVNINEGKERFTFSPIARLLKDQKGKECVMTRDGKVLKDSDVELDKPRL